MVTILRNFGIGTILVLSLVLLFVGCMKKSETGLYYDIKAAQTLLTKERAGYTVKTVKGKSEVEYNVLLAVKHFRTNKIEIIRLTKNGTKAPSGFSVGSGRPNGVNTQFDVSYPVGYTVLALRRCIRDGSGFREVVYTPYTPEINTQEMRMRGAVYLKNVLAEAESDLKRRNVGSKAYPGELVSTMIPKRVARVLAKIEHIDPARFEAAGKDAKKREQKQRQLMDEVLVIIAANGKHAYEYSVSPKVGARGLFQFIQSTYDNICRLYPKAGLIPDFVKGMRDHRNAAKASLLLFDSDLSYVPAKQREFYRKNPEVMGKYLAAAYNGGAGCAAKAIREHGVHWESFLYRETQCYIEKFKAVWGMSLQ
jgi:hypothetical protein